MTYLKLIKLKGQPEISVKLKAPKEVLGLYKNTYNIHNDRKLKRIFK